MREQERIEESENEERKTDALCSEWTAPYDSEQERLGQEHKLDFDKCFSFVDLINKTSAYNNAANDNEEVDRAWYPDEKYLVRFLFSCALKKTPGLVLNAMRGHKIKLLARRNCGQLGFTGTAFFDTISFAEPNFALNSACSYKDLSIEKVYFACCFHELAHLCSPGGLVSHSDQWLGAVHPIISQWNKAAAKGHNDLLSPTVGCPTFQRCAKNRQPVAHNFGLPSEYATTNSEECLAEYAADFIVIKSLSNFDGETLSGAQLPKIKNFIEQELLRYPNQKLEAAEPLRKLYDLDLIKTLNEETLASLNNNLTKFKRAWEIDSFLLTSYSSSPTYRDKIPEIYSKSLQESRSDFATDNERSQTLTADLAFHYSSNGKVSACIKQLETLAKCEHLKHSQVTAAMSYAESIGAEALVLKLYYKNDNLESLPLDTKLKVAWAIKFEQGEENAVAFLHKVFFQDKQARLKLEEARRPGDSSNSEELFKTYIADLALRDPKNTQVILLAADVLQYLEENSNFTQLTSAKSATSARPARHINKSLAKKESTVQELASKIGTVTIVISDNEQLSSMHKGDPSQKHAQANVLTSR